MSFLQFADKHIFATMFMLYLIFDMVQFLICLVLGKKKMASLLLIIIGSLFKIGSEQNEIHNRQ
ncbi:hypothetical protein [Clostridium scatologenes]|uniref:Uncharacterized protein n=1 Tax=Clostridium scatologenes TaxID=1548 RepID=A0A0E3M9M8_CLOSL|nr:hypothetical protein [Clostridium scatologenes]AKA71219.1 hypothetical protein CSCA_4094 [Clostridium scatologenes]